MSRTGLGAVVLLCSLALTGCAGAASDRVADSSSTARTADEGESPSAPRSTAAAATGESVSGDGFTFTAPEGWSVLDAAQMPSINFLALAGKDGDPDGFGENVNVIEDPTIVGIDLDQIEGSISKVLEGVTSEVAVGDRLQIDGETASAVTALYDGAVSYRTLQHIVEHDGTGYIITFSFSEDVPAAEQLEIAGSVAATWQWTS